MKEKAILGDNMLRYQKVLAMNIVLAPDLELKVKVLIWKDAIPALPPRPLYTKLKVNVYISNIYHLKLNYTVYTTLSFQHA